MNRNPELEEGLKTSMANLDEGRVLSLYNSMLEHGYDSYTVFGILNEGAREVGNRFANGEYFIADLIASGMIYISVLELAQSSMMPSSAHEYTGKVLIGVVEHDIHDIGKDIVCGVLQSEGFEVIDLGTDVKAETFAEAAKTHRPDIIALGGVLSFSTIEMEKTIRLLIETGVREYAKIIIGGACTDENVRVRVDADACFSNPMDALKYCKKVVAKK